MKHSTEFIQSLMSRLNFPDNAKAIFTEILKKLDSDKEFSDPFDRAYKSYMFPLASELKAALGEMTKHADTRGENVHTLHMTFILSCMEELYRRYKLFGIDEEIYWQGADDIRCKLLECIECQGVPGTFVGSWFNGMFNMNRFALGRFQYEKAHFTHEGAFTTKSGHKIEDGSFVLKFHIPSSGIPLSDGVRFDSYKKAFEFYRDSFEGPAILVCSSWLLYPEYQKVFPENSNLRRFANDFEIVASTDEEGFGDAWRVFGKDAGLPSEQLPEKTSLQRSFKKWLTNGGRVGSGYGIILFDGEKIL